jgi:hypothetical protein
MTLSDRQVGQVGASLLITAVGVGVDFAFNTGFFGRLALMVLDPFNLAFLGWLVTIFLMPSLIAYVLKLRPRKYGVNCLILIGFSSLLLARNVLVAADLGIRLGCPAQYTDKAIPDKETPDGYRYESSWRWCPITQPWGILVMLGVFYYTIIPILMGATNPIVRAKLIYRRYAKRSQGQ